MATEPLQAAPYPVSTDAPDAPAQGLALASWARLKVVQVYASAAARTAAFSAALVSPTEGMLSWLQDQDRYEFYNGSAWVPLLGYRGTNTATIAAAANSGAVAVNFPAALPATPLVFCQVDSVVGGIVGNFGARITARSASGFTCTMFRTDGTTAGASQGASFSWWAILP